MTGFLLLVPGNKLFSNGTLIKDCVKCFVIMPNGDVISASEIELLMWHWRDDVNLMRKLLSVISVLMPDKRYARGCGSACLRCWHNRLKYANPTVKKFMKKHNIDSIHTDEYNKSLLELKLKNLEKNSLIDTDEYRDILLQLKLENQKRTGSLHINEYNIMLSKLRSDEENQKKKSLIYYNDNEDTMI